MALAADQVLNTSLDPTSFIIPSGHGYVISILYHDGMAGQPATKLNTTRVINGKTISQSYWISNPATKPYRLMFPPIVPVNLLKGNKFNALSSIIIPPCYAQSSYSISLSNGFQPSSTIISTSQKLEYENAKAFYQANARGDAFSYDKYYVSPEYTKTDRALFMIPGSFGIDDPIAVINYTISDTNKKFVLLIAPLMTTPVNVSMKLVANVPIPSDDARRFSTMAISSLHCATRQFSDVTLGSTGIVRTTDKYKRFTGYGYNHNLLNFDSLNYMPYVPDGGYGVISSQIVVYGYYQCILAQSIVPKLEPVKDISDIKDGGYLLGDLGIAKGLDPIKTSLNCFDKLSFKFLVSGATGSGSTAVTSIGGSQYFPELLTNNLGLRASKIENPKYKPDYEFKVGYYKCSDVATAVAELLGLSNRSSLDYLAFSPDTLTEVRKLFKDKFGYRLLSATIIDQRTGAYTINEGSSAITGIGGYYPAAGLSKTLTFAPPYLGIGTTEKPTWKIIQNTFVPFAIASLEFVAGGTTPDPEPEVDPSILFQDDFNGTGEVSNKLPKVGKWIPKDQHQIPDIVRKYSSGLATNAVILRDSGVMRMQQSDVTTAGYSKLYLASFKQSTPKYTIIFDLNTGPMISSTTEYEMAVEVCLRCYEKNGIILPKIVVAFNLIKPGNIINVETYYRTNVNKVDNATQKYAYGLTHIDTNALKNKSVQQLIADGAKNIGGSTYSYPYAKTVQKSIEVTNDHEFTNIQIDTTQHEPPLSHPNYPLTYEEDYITVSIGGISYKIKVPYYGTYTNELTGFRFRRTSHSVSDASIPYPSIRNLSIVSPKSATEYVRSSETIITDDFNRADNKMVSKNWLDFMGNVEIKNGKIDIGGP